VPDPSTPDDAEARCSVLRHHDLKMVHAAPDFRLVLVMPFKKRSEIERIGIVRRGPQDGSGRASP
jgi:hypothetical protein